MSRAATGDGTVVETRAGAVYDIPPGHDAWVVGDEPVVAFEYSGAGIAVRAGLHTGEVAYVEGDVRGLAVHAAARVMSLAPARGSALSFRNGGRHELKGDGPADRLRARRGRALNDRRTAPEPR